VLEGWEILPPRILVSPAFRRTLNVVIIVSLFLGIWGAKLWVVNRYGSDIPNWDQWDAEAGVLYLPYFHHAFSAENIFHPHNEHRIVFTQLLNMALLLVNGQWDARLQCVVNAALHASLALGFWWWLRPQFSRRAGALLLLGVAVLFAVPFSMQNVLGGFHSQQYFLLWTSLASIYLLLTARAFSVSWWIGSFLVVAGDYSMASGLLAGAAVLAVLTVRVAKREITLTGVAPTAAFATLAVVLGFLTRADAQNHVHLRAHTLADFVITCAHCFEWPFRVHPLVGLFCYFPVLWFTASYVRRRSLTAFDHVLAGFVIWLVLQVAATGYARGAGQLYPASRYLDTLSLGILLSTIALARVLQLHFSSGKRIGLFAAIASVWIVVIGYGLWTDIARSFRDIYPAVGQQMAERERNLRAYVATGDIAHLQGKEIPYPSAEVLVERLSHKAIRDILPASVRAPLPLPPAFASAGFVKNGAPPALGSPWPGDVVWGSYTSHEGAAHQGQWQSSHLFTHYAWLHFDVTGDTAAGGATVTIEGLQKSRPILPANISAQKWRSVYVPAPHSTFHLAANDSSATDWVAFSQPREMASLSYWSMRLARSGERLTKIALSVLAACILARVLLPIDERRELRPPTGT
jgi:hypothetical protein